MKRAIAAVLIGVCIAAGLWQYRRMNEARTGASGPAEPQHAEWLDRLYSQNPREVEAATKEVASLGERAIPAIQTTLRDPRAEAEQLKAALKAVGILGKVAIPALPEVSAVLAEPGLTAEAAIALSHMGPKAFGPLRDALASRDPVVRREALRSIGKLKERAPLELGMVLPLLLDWMTDPDESVRAVAATYLGIIHEGAEQAVPALINGLTDSDPEVHRTSAEALGSFGAAGAPALPALRKATTDRNISTLPSF